LPTKQIKIRSMYMAITYVGTIRNLYRDATTKPSNSYTLNLAVEKLLMQFNFSKPINSQFFDRLK
jgi:hypothetical protein